MTTKTPLLAACLSCLSLVAIGWAQAAPGGSVEDPIPEFWVPILATSCAESSGLTLLRDVCDGILLPCTVWRDVTAEDLEGTCAVCSGETIYGSVLIVVGHTAAEDLARMEIDRCIGVLDVARQHGVPVIVAILDPSEASDSQFPERIARELGPRGDAFIALDTAAATQALAALSRETGIPLLFISEPADLAEVLRSIFAEALRIIFGVPSPP